MSDILPLESTSPEEVTETFERISSSMTWSKALYVALLFVICVVGMRLVISILDRTMTRLRIEPTVHKFTRSCLKVIMWMVTLLVLAGYIGIPVDSFVAVLGIIGVALSLALQVFCPIWPVVSWSWCPSPLPWGTMWMQRDSPVRWRRSDLSIPG